MSVRTRFDDFSAIYDLATKALYKRGNAKDHGFLITQEGVLLKAARQGPNLRPDLSDPFGLPMEPHFRKNDELENGLPQNKVRLKNLSPNNKPKCRPPGFNY